MSFILDALKKSETDRQQKASPGIADVPGASRRKSTAPWVPALIALLLVNLAAVAYLVFRPSAAPDEPAQADVSSSRLEAATTRAAAPPPADPAPAASRDERPAPFSERRIADATPSEPKATPAPAPDAQTGDPLPAPEPAMSPAVQPSTEPVASAAEDESWLTLNDLRASGRVDLPEMHIDLHVFSDNPGDRFVFINMNEYRENSTLPEGPSVNRITPEGVLLDYRGTTFLLPRD